MVTDRRNDLGGKLAWFLVALMITGFTGFAWAQALKGEAKADEAIQGVSENKLKIAVLTANFEAVNYRLDEIKTLIKSIHP